MRTREGIAHEFRSTSNTTLPGEGERERGGKAGGSGGDGWRGGTDRTSAVSLPVRGSSHTKGSNRLVVRKVGRKDSIDEEERQETKEGLNRRREGGKEELDKDGKQKRKN